MDTIVDCAKQPDGTATFLVRDEEGRSTYKLRKDIDNRTYLNFLERQKKSLKCDHAQVLKESQQVAKIKKPKKRCSVQLKTLHTPQLELFLGKNFSHFSGAVQSNQEHPNDPALIVKNKADQTAFLPLSVVRDNTQLFRSYMEHVNSKATSS